MEMMNRAILAVGSTATDKNSDCRPPADDGRRHGLPGCVHGLLRRIC